MKKIVVSVSCLVFCRLAIASPFDGQVAAGEALISQSGNSTVINQTSQSAVINWQGFNTVPGESVQFIQPNNNAVAVNRITSGYPTSFAGSLSANGHVWILNPAGVVFTKNSSVNVAGLLATTMDIKDEDVMQGKYNFYSVVGYENSSVINNGVIDVRNAGEMGVVAMVAPNVINGPTGVIHAKTGKIALASGTAFVLDFNGDELINFAMPVANTPPAQNGHVINQGNICGEAGSTVWMTANAVAGVLDNVIDMSGVIEAKSVENKFGQIILNGGNSGVVKISGKLKVDKNGGILTAGQKIDYAGAEINPGVGGIWTYSTPNISVDANLANLINIELNNGSSVALQSPDDIAVNAVIIVKASDYKFPERLMFRAGRDININQSVFLQGDGEINLYITAKNININTAEIHSRGSQNYSGNINLLNNVSLTTEQKGVISFDVINGLDKNLRLISGRGITGSVHVKNLSLGGTGGANLVNSSVNGHMCAEAWNIITVGMLSTGDYWFNGIRDWSGVTPETDDVIIDREIFVKPQDNTTNLDLGETDLEPMDTNPSPEIAGEDQAVDVNLYTYETCQGRECGEIDVFYKKHPHKIS